MVHKKTQQQESSASRAESRSLTALQRQLQVRQGTDGWIASQPGFINGSMRMHDSCGACLIGFNIVHSGSKEGL